MVSAKKINRVGKERWAKNERSKCYLNPLAKEGLFVVVTFELRPEGSGESNCRCRSPEASRGRREFWVARGGEWKEVDSDLLGHYKDFLFDFVLSEMRSLSRECWYDVTFFLARSLAAVLIMGCRRVRIEGGKAVKRLFWLSRRWSDLPASWL